LVDATMTRLSALEGIWRGRGSGNYPTIDSFEYDETLIFEPDASYPLIHYRQRTRLLPSGESSHWESGFIRPLDDGVVEVSNSQDSGRVEVLRGRLDDGEPLRLVLDSVVLDHDPRLVQTRRILTLQNGTLRYEVQMSTRTTPEPVLQTHLEAVLSRAE
jgi:hypothetical protein